MSIPDRYFHNRTILLLLIINSILLVTGVLIVLFRLDSDTTTTYIVEYRAKLGIDEFKFGKALDIASFALFMALNFTLGVLLSIRTFGIRKHIAVMVLGIAALVALLTIIVSNALLALS